MGYNLLRKFMSFSYGSLIALVIGFLGTMITTRILIPEDFGKASMFTLVLNISMIFVLLGTDQSFVRFFYEENEEKRGGLLYSCLKITLVMAVLVSVFIVIFRETISFFLFEETNLIALVMLIFGMLAQTLYRYGRLVIRMQQNGHVYSIIEIINKSLSLLVLIGLYFLMGASYEIIIYSSVISLMALAMFAIVYGKKYWNPKNLYLTELAHSNKDIIRYGYPLVLTMSITWLFQSFDKIALKHWSTLGELGLYAAAFKIIALVNVGQTSFSTFWAPVCYEQFEKDPNNRDFYGNMSKIVSFSMFFIAILCIAGKDIIGLLLGRNYREASDIMPFLAFMPILYTISETTVIGINFYKKPKWHILIASVSCIVNILGNWVLVPKYGAVGAAISTAFAYIVFFSLRTQISLLYFKVNYGLKKTYFMLALISLYALYSVITSNLYLNLLSGLGVIFIMIFIYKKDLIKGYAYIKSKKSVMDHKM